MESKPFKLPLRFSSTESSTEIFDANNLCVCGCQGDNPELEKAIKKEIIDAVNNHHRLKSERDELLEEVKNSREAYHYSCANKLEECPAPSCKRVRKLIEKCEAK